MSNRRKTPKIGERVVVLVCTGGATVHPRRKLGVIAIRNGEAVEIERRGNLRRAIVASDIGREAPGVEMSAFDFYCSQCGGHLQRSQKGMREDVSRLLAESPAQERVPVDLRSI